MSEDTPGRQEEEQGSHSGAGDHLRGYPGMPGGAGGGSLWATPLPGSVPQMSMDSNDVLPRHFDAAAKWPGMIHEPLDQGNCAGSWAFSTAGERGRGGLGGDSGDRDGTASP